MNKIPLCKKLLSTPKSIVIIMHAQPDADALGSSLGLAAFLKKLHHEVSIVSPTTYPNFLNWMPGIQEVLIFSEEREKVLALLFEAALIFCIDFSSLQRIEAMGTIVSKTTAIKIVIDHHTEPEGFSALQFWDPKAAASAVLVYQFIEALAKKEYIDQGIAACLYAGIVTDTNSFSNPNTTAVTHRIAASLIDLGADVTQINQCIYSNNSLDRLKFISFAITHRLVLLKEYHTAYFAIRSEDFKVYNLQTGDTEGLVNYALSLKGVMLAALLKEKEGIVVISLRSKGTFLVDVLAHEHFDGGGHHNAAGGKSYLPLQETIAKFETLVKQSPPTININKFSKSM